MARTRSVFRGLVFFRVAKAAHQCADHARRNFGIAPGDVSLIQSLEKRQQVVTVLFGNVYAAKNLEGLSHVVLAYENSPFTQKLVPQILFGARPAKGILPVSVSTEFTQGVGGFLNSQNGLIGSWGFQKRDG